VIVLTKY